MINEDALHLKPWTKITVLFLCRFCSVGYDYYSGERKANPSETFGDFCYPR